MSDQTDVQGQRLRSDEEIHRANRLTLFFERVQLQSTNAQTPPKTEEDQRPESKTIQQLAEPDEVCKTSTPGSNPGGASNFPQKSIGSFARSGMPARTKFRTAVHRRSCGMRPGQPACAHAFFQAFVNRTMGLPLTLLPVR